MKNLKKTGAASILQEDLSKPMKIDSAQAPTPAVTANPNLTTATLFVSTLPFEATKELLDEFFSEIGPIKSSFIVLDKETKKSSGCGYVQYALKEDAKRALVELKKKKFMNKRILKMVMATKKSITSGKREAAGELLESVKKKIKVSPEGPGKSPANLLLKKLNNSVTILIENLPATLTKKHIYKKVRKFGTVEKLEYNEHAECPSAKVAYSSATEAQKACKGLDAHIFKGCTIRCKIIETITPASIAKKSRLIVRNLAFHCTAAQLKTVFEPFGAIKECSVPSGADGKARGFGFVQFEELNGAQKAIETMNGNSILKRPVAVDWALGKSEYERMASAADAMKEIEASNDDYDGVPLRDDDAPILIEEDLNDGRDDDPEQHLERQRELEDSTIFVRRLDFNATSQELRNCFEKWGPLRYAVITLDKVTNLSKGNGFVSFINVADAKKCLETYQSLSSAIGTEQIAANENSALNPNMSNIARTLSDQFLIHGRVVSVTPTVSKCIAEKITHASTLSRRVMDKRNLYLLKEGVILPGSVAAGYLEPKELEYQSLRYANKKRLLSTNPNLFLSKTRLSVRGLPSTVIDSDLRKRAKEAVAEFWRECDSGAREPLEAEVVEEEVAGGSKIPCKARRVNIKQAKVIRDMERIDSKTKKPKSKGYGFVEFHSHADALACLRFLNFRQWDTISGKSVAKGKRIIVEFAIENKLVLNQREKRKETSKAPANEEKLNKSISKNAIKPTERSKERKSKIDSTKSGRRGSGKVASENPKKSALPDQKLAAALLKGLKKSNNMAPKWAIAE